MSEVSVPSAESDRGPAGAFVRVDNVEKSFRSHDRRVKAVDGVSLSIRPGEFVSVVGPSGCGKSTLMMMVSGLIPVSGGRIEVCQKTVAKPVTDVGIVFQRDALLEWRTVLDNVLLQVDVRGLARAPVNRRRTGPLQPTTAIPCLC